jgi:uncharacterized protein
LNIRPQLLLATATDRNYSLMQIPEISPLLAKHCKRFHVKTLDVFGSYSRGHETPESDLDLLVEFEELPPSQYAQNYFGLLHSIEDELPLQIDLLTRNSVKRRSLREAIEREKIRVYET